MKPVATLLFALTVAACTTPPPRREITGSFDCDTAAGSASKWTLAATHLPIQLSGTLELVKVRKDQRWAPTATLFTVDRGGQTGLRISWSSRDATASRVAFFPSGQSSQPEIIGEFVPIKGPAQFSIAVDVTGRAVFRLGEIERVAERD